MPPLILLISSTNRGLGKGLLQSYLAKPDHIVIATNRDRVHLQSQALNGLPKGPGSRLIMVKVDATVESDASVAAEDHVAQGINNPKIADAMAQFAPNVMGGSLAIAGYTADAAEVYEPYLGHYRFLRGNAPGKFLSLFMS
ncbi:hypothetical protein DL764_007848 [Monosporascus ibericus]|uniref:Uncharacterized protein n=1 Tax=Monosporascus ibericus TaxID=155417 RepID=A0A4Q4T2F1_9PEZI|nr:hypothetical protein DL764_007848 [Monosporascus ibericus]